MEDGRWFCGQDASEDVLQVIIGGGLSEKYKTGDTLTLDYGEGKKREGLVIGSLGTDFYMLGDSGFGTGDRDLGSYVSGDGDVVLSNDGEWFSWFGEQAVYPALSIMVKIREGADLSKYARYGVLTSFQQVMENSREKCRNFIWDAVVRGESIWIFAVVFGVFGVSYATAESMRRTWGIYSLLGMTGNQLLGRLMLQNIFTCLAGGIAANIVAPYFAHALNYYYEITIPDSRS